MAARARGVWAAPLSGRWPMMFLQKGPSGKGKPTDVELSAKRNETQTPVSSTNCQDETAQFR
eukprot:1574749-Prymnesium_polylepis.1